MRRRVVAALWFGAWAAGTATLLYGARGWTVDTALYTALPGAAAAAAGGLLGHRLLDPNAVSHGLWAAFHGVAIVLAAHVLYAPMFAVGFALTDPLEGTVNIPGFSLAALVFGLQATGPVTIPVGAVAGYLLYRFRRGGPSPAPPTPSEPSGEHP